MPYVLLFFLTLVRAQACFDLLVCKKNDLMSGVGHCANAWWDTVWLAPWVCWNWDVFIISACGLL